MSRARDEYDSMVGGLLSAVWQKNGEFLSYDPSDTETPLTALLEAEAGSTRVDPDWTPPELDDVKGMDREGLLELILELMERRHRDREHMLNVFFNFLFARGPDPLAVLQRLFIYARACHSGHAWGMQQNEVAALFGHSKQNWQHLEEEVIEDLVTRWSRTEFVNSGGKSVAARLAYAKLRLGNSIRKNGRRSGDELPPLPAKEHPDQPLSAQAKRRARAMRDDAERRRLAKEFGCRPEEIDLTKISLPRD